MIHPDIGGTKVKYYICMCISLLSFLSLVNVEKTGKWSHQSEMKVLKD